MEWIDLLIPVMIFALPVIVALIDKKYLKKRGIPAVLSQPISFEDEETASTLREKGASVNVGKDRKDEEDSAIASEESETPELVIDRKKLILYSEILKPKFDE